MKGRVVAVAHRPGAAGAELLDRAIALAGFREAAAERIAAALGRTGACSAIVVPALDAFAKESPAATDPRLVEHLLDLLFDLGATDVRVGSSPGTASLWLENREVFMTAELLGYRYDTPAGRPYDVVDLAEDVAPAVFPEGGPLAGTGLARAWLDADLRLVFSANRTDEDDGYALCLATLLSVLPAADRDQHYRRRRDAGEVIIELLATAPPHFAFIDAVSSGHGGAGGRALRPLRTDTVIAASDAALADYVGALKMGLDPFVSGLAAPSLRLARPGPDTRILGPLDAYGDWVNVDARVIASTAERRRSAVAADRSIRPILQKVDRELFPFRDPANDWLNEALADLAAAGEGGGALITLLNLWLGELGKAALAWGILFDKDALSRRDAPINIDPGAFSLADYRALAGELGGRSALLSGLAIGAEGLRWRFDDGAVEFDGARRIAQPFARFVEAVEIGRTIQFMNDYIGGDTLVTGRDRRGRVTRQIERNLYLPQPNYTALGGGVTIDVTKIEAMEYQPRRQRMFWKTVRSENDSAIADDGVVTFEALGEDTLVTIWGRQHFRLPPLWAAIDRELSPAIKRALVTEAYDRFFRRTFGNLEAVAEGRDVRIGRPASDDPAGEPLPIKRLESLARSVGAGAEGGFDLAGLVKGLIAPSSEARPEPLRIDADGFRHFQGAPPAARPAARATSALAGVFRELEFAAKVDAGAQP